MRSLNAAVCFQLLLCCTWASAVSAASFHDRRQTGTSETSGAGYAFGKSGVDASFDYVVIGGGTGGLAIATRLAENPSISVAVIEAGGFYEADDGNISVVPAYDIFYAGTGANTTNPLVDWGFLTQPQAGCNNRKLHYARGKTLGGSSARNFMFYQRQVSCIESIAFTNRCRPTVGAMQRWSDDVSDPSYTFANLLPFYKKSVHYTPPSIAYPNSSNVQDSSAFDPSGGPLQVSFGKYDDPFGTWAQKALQAAGEVAIAGFQIGRLIGSAYLAFTVNPVNGHRSSSEASFLQSAKSPTNLFIYNNTLAQRIIFKGPQNTAQGVTVSSVGTDVQESGPIYTLNAKHEVILSAGGFQSPQLLMVSGIGPRETLESHGITVLKDLPGVGQNMQDHVFWGTSFQVDVTTSSSALNHPELEAEAVQEYNENATGPLTNPIVPVLGWEKIPQADRAGFSTATQQALSTFPADWPEIEFIPIGTVLGYAADFAAGDPVNGNNYATMSTVIIAALSRGNVSISSSKMTDPPLINPNWMTHPADQELAIAAFKRSREVWKFMSNITVGEEYLPGPQVQSDADILNFIRQALSPVWHAASTCKMGRPTDPMAVVDTQTRVYGTKRLRVVDASAFAVLPPGHPQSTVYALAEKIASEIKAGRT
ncbi:hypothetical protein HO173_003955 [Letharia columbiana]|uniref:GMC oxidoreductase n=1 Tax=Letharia columbiana TaxID=112416 RepID=A0A8H6FZM0_9LECA|nr:uncharacterized protein HO173_003955 [Letharia columbiana]KAF6237754.1 hypothetical protein HO173_003955 [Letharia columbiana]